MPLRNHRTIRKAFFLISVAGSLFVSAEMIMQLQGKSICYTEGCKIVSRYVRFGDLSILALGLALFAGLALLSALAMRRNKPLYEKVITQVLVVSLACEGFFTGYQVFRMETFCLFCLIVFCLLVLLGILRFLAGEREVAAGFASLLGVFMLFYLVLPAGTVRKLPDDPLLLFYSTECKHCKELMKEIEGKATGVKHQLVDDYAGLLQSIGISGVPTLVINRGGELKFLTGKEAIKRYLLNGPVPGGGGLLDTPASLLTLPDDVCKEEIGKKCD